MDGKGSGSVWGFRTIKEEALRALKKITGQEIGLDQAAWKKWLQKVKGEVGDTKQQTVGEDLTVGLEAKESKTALAEAGGKEYVQQLGITVQTLTHELAQRLGYEGLEGVVVTETEPGSLADRASIKSGVLIKEVNRQPVKNPKEFNDAIEQACQKGGEVLLLIKDENYTRVAVLSFPKK